MTKVQEKGAPLANSNLKNLKPFRGSKEVVPLKAEKTEPPKELKSEITEQAKSLNQLTADNKSIETPEALEKAASLAKKLATVPVLPLIAPKNTKILDTKESKETIKEASIHFIKKPVVIFIEGFSALGISNGDGIRDMAENFPGAKKFDWTDHKEIISEIKKHAPNEPVVLVGHSFGGDTAIEVANELNSAKNGFRAVDLLVSIDAVGMNKTIIPVNVKSNLNFFGEGIIPFIHGDPTVARNTKYTEVTNELRSDMHSKMEDSPEVQFEIFQKINQVLGQSGEEDIFIEISETSQIKDVLEALKNSI